MELVTRQLLVPLRHELRQREVRQPLPDPEIPFFHADLRNKLGARFQHMSTQASGKRLLPVFIHVSTEVSPWQSVLDSRWRFSRKRAHLNLWLDNDPLDERLWLRLLGAVSKPKIEQPSQNLTHCVPA